jgi:hypothetical protein
LVFTKSWNALCVDWDHCLASFGFSGIVMATLVVAADVVLLREPARGRLSCQSTRPAGAPEIEERDGAEGGSNPRPRAMPAAKLGLRDMQPSEKLKARGVYSRAETAPAPDSD